MSIPSYQSPRDVRLLSPEMFDMTVTQTCPFSAYLLTQELYVSVDHVVREESTVTECTRRTLFGVLSGIRCQRTEKSLD